MSHDRDRFRVELDVNAGEERRQAPDHLEAHNESAESASGPFCIVLLGDFSGRASRGIVEGSREIGSRRAIRVDRDSVDAAIAKLSPEIRLATPGTTGGAPITVRLRDLDDLHPDKLYQQVPHFQALRDARARAAAPQSMQQLSREPEVGRAPSGGGSARRTSRPAPASGAGGGLLDQILGDAPEPPVAPRRSAPHESTHYAEGPADSLQDFVRQVVAPHLVPGATPRQQEMVASVDAAISAQMREVLHESRFQSVESAWRAVDFLVRRLDTDDSLRVYLVDVSREELAADLSSAERVDDVGRTGTYKLLVDSTVGTPGAHRWALMVGLYSFDESLADANLLLRLALVARAAGAPFVAAAKPSLVGTPSFGEVPDHDDWGPAASLAAAHWHNLRHSALARHLGLVAPRFMLRAPYGKGSDECELLRFEELDGFESGTQHERYLWGNGAVVCALILGDAFANDGWTLRPQGGVGGLPVHVAKTDDGPVATPCAEALLTERAAARIMDAGVMALASMKDSDSVRLVRMQSIAAPLGRLAGRWVEGGG
jgi:type VI secretion system protein ImpC